MLDEGRTSYVVERDDRLVVVRDAPALICRQCGEAYFENEVALALYEQAEKLLAEGHDVEIAKYAGLTDMGSGSDDEEGEMRCCFCKTGESAPGATTVTLDRNGTVVVVRDVPADVCRQCGEAFLSVEVADEVSRRADKAVENGAEFEILKFAA